MTNTCNMSICGFSSFDDYCKWYDKALVNRYSKRRYLSDEEMNALENLSHAVGKGFGSVLGILDAAQSTSMDVTIINKIAKSIDGEGIAEAVKKIEEALKNVSTIMDYPLPE